MEEPHRRLTVWALAVWGMAVSSEANRAMLKPCSRVCCTQPQITSSISAGSTWGLRWSRALIMAAERVSARTWRNMPPLDRPMGERTASMTTASCMSHFSS